MVRIREIGTGGLVSIGSYSRPSLMIIVPGTQFHIYLPCLKCLNSVLNVKALVDCFQPAEGPRRGRDCTTSRNLREPLFGHCTAQP